MSNLVAIVGRPNVGKSTLFNRLTNSRRAIVSDEAGTTRDRQYGKCEWNGREFSVVDTGGWVVNSDDIFEEEIRKQVIVATEEADLVLFLVDIKNGLTDLDQDVALILRRSKLPVVLVANKADDGKDLYGQYEFYKLGLGDPFCVSAATGSGTGDLLDHVLSKLPAVDISDIDDNTPRFAVVGRPNAGKSSIINAFIGEDRNIVTEIAGTTRDSIYTKYDKFGFDFYLVDTAGIRRKNKVTEDLEFYSVMRGTGHEHLPAHPEEQQVARRCCQQMGPRRRQVAGRHHHLRGRHPSAHGTVRRFPHYLRFGCHQAAHLQGPRNCQGGLSQPQVPHWYHQAQRGHVAYRRTDAATLYQGQVHQDQVRLAGSRYADSYLRVLRQLAPVHQGALPSFPRKQAPRKLDAHWHTYQRVHPTEVNHEVLFLTTNFTNYTNE